MHMHAGSTYFGTEGGGGRCGRVFRELLWKLFDKSSTSFAKEIRHNLMYLAITVVGDGDGECGLRVRHYLVQWIFQKLCAVV